VALLEVRTGLGCRDGSDVPEEGAGVFLRGSGPSSVRPWTPAGRRGRPVL